jgi:6-phosphogluconolactonase (cycloisomerase 2 family)
MDIRLLATALSLGLALAACGGGGGDDGSSSAAFVARDYAFTANFAVSAPGAVAVFAIDPASGAPAAVPGSPFAAETGTTGTIDVAVDPQCKFVYAANLFSPNISGYKVDAITGTLTSVAGSPFQTGGPLPEALAMHPSGRFLYAATSSNSIAAYAIDRATGTLTSRGSVAGPASGLSAIAVHPGGRFLYASAGGSSGGISVYSIDLSSGALADTGFAPAGTAGASSITVDPGGKFLYGAVTLPTGVSSYSIDAGTGALTSLGPDVATTAMPGSMAVGRDSRFLYVLSSSGGNLFGYAIGATGTLTTIGTFSAEGGARSIAVDSSGKFAYVANVLEGTLSRFAIAADTGMLTSLGAVAVPAGSASFPNPSAVTIAHRSAP